MVKIAKVKDAHGLRCSDRVVCYTNETQIFKLFQLGAYEYPS